MLVALSFISLNQALRTLNALHAQEDNEVKVYFRHPVAVQLDFNSTTVLVNVQTVTKPTVPIHASVMMLDTLKTIQMMGMGVRANNIMRKYMMNVS